MWLRKKLRPQTTRRGFLLRSGEEISKLTSLKRRRFSWFPPFHRFWRASKIILLITFAVLFTSWLVYLVFFSSFIHIQKITYVPNTPVFSTHMAPLIGKNLLFHAFTPLKLKILESYPDEIKSISFKRKFPSMLTVSYEPYPNSANVVIRLTDIQKKFIINGKGLVVQEDSEDPELPYITFEMEELPKLKDQIIPEDFLNKMVKAENLFTDKFGMKVNEVRYKRKEREAHLVTERNFAVLLDLTQDVETQLFKLKRALPGINIFQDNLEYIDLRIAGQTGDKVIFKKRT